MTFLASRSLCTVHCPPLTRTYVGCGSGASLRFGARWSESGERIWERMNKSGYASSSRDSPGIADRSRGNKVEPSFARQPLDSWQVFGVGGDSRVDADKGPCMSRPGGRLQGSEKAAAVGKSGERHGCLGSGLPLGRAAWPEVAEMRVVEPHFGVGTYMYQMVCMGVVCLKVKCHGIRRAGAQLEGCMVFANSR